MGPHDASMATLYVRNRRRAKYGEIPLSAGEIEYLSRKDEAARRRQRLLEVRNHEKRVAQLVTQRYRDNLRRMHTHKLRGAQLAHQQQQEALLGELHRKYQQSLQNVGSAHRQAREMLAELMEDAHLEQSKWTYNEARVAKARSGEASRLHDEEKEAEIARRKEVEDNLQRLKEMSMKQRAQASIRARREQELQIELARRQEEAVRFRRQAVKEEVLTMSRSRAKDVDAYQFTRLHCVSAPPVPTTALKPRAEVKVIRHNRAHPSAVNGIDEAKKYRDEMDAKREQERSLREQNVEKAGQRGDHALEQVKSKQDGEKAIEWLQQIDKAQRYEQTIDYAHDFQDGRAAGGENDKTPSQANERAAEETFRRMFAIVHDDPLELSTHSARTEEDVSVDRVAMSPLRHQQRVSIDPADSEFGDDDDDDAHGRESFSPSQQDSLNGSLGFEAITATFDQMRKAHKSGRHRNLPESADNVPTGKEFGEDVQPAKDPAYSENLENTWNKEKPPRKVDHSEQRSQEHQSIDERKGSRQEHGGRDSFVPSDHFHPKERDDIHEDHRASRQSFLSSEGEASKDQQQRQRNEAQGDYSRERTSRVGLQSDVRLGDHLQPSKYQQQRQRDEAQGGHARMRYSQTHLQNQERLGDQLQLRDEILDARVSFRFSASKDSIAKRNNTQPFERDEEGSADEHASLHSFASSHGRANRGDYELHVRDEMQEDHTSLRKQEPRSSLRFSAQSDGGEDELHRHSRASSDHGGNVLDERFFESNDERLSSHEHDREPGEEHASLHSPAPRRSFHEAYTAQGERVHLHLAASIESRASEDSRHQPQQYEAESEHAASARSSVSSSQSGLRTELQLQQQRHKAQDERVSIHSSSSSSRQSGRSDDELHQRNEPQEDRASIYSSVSGRESEASIEYQLQQGDDAFDGRVSLWSSVSSSHSARRDDHQPHERYDTQEERVGQRSPASSTSGVGEDSLRVLQQQGDLRGKRSSLHPSVSSESRSSGNVLQSHFQQGDADEGVGNFTGQDSFASSARRSSLELPRPGPLVAEHTSQYSPASSCPSSHQADDTRRSSELTNEPSTGFSDSFVRRQLLSESEESFDDSVSVGSVGDGIAGDRGRLYIQKIHERLQNFVGRSSASSSVAQYSLPLSDSMSSINESFHDHLAAGYGDDSFIHKLVPMFPAPGALAIEQMNEVDHKIQEQYDVQLVDPALSRMLSDSLYFRRSSHAPSHVPLNVDNRDVQDETEAQTRRFEQWTIEEQREAAQMEMEQHSLLSDSGSGVSSVGFSALLHLTAGTTRNARDDDAERAALESEEKAEKSDHLDRRSQRRFSSDSSLSADARFNYLASMTAAVGESLPLHLRLPPMIYGNKDMSVPPRPIKWPSPPSSSVSGHSITHSERGSSEREQRNQQKEQKSGDLNKSSDGEEHDSDRADFAGREQEQESSHQSSEDCDDSNDEMQYEEFRRGLLEGKMGSLPPPPFGNMDMSRPPPPLIRPQGSSGSQNSRSSSMSSSYSSAASRDRASRGQAERDLDEEDKREIDEGESHHDNSFFSEESASAVSRRERHKRGESLFISVGSDENEEQKEEVNHGRAVSLADAFRQRHPRFRERVEEHREQQQQKRQQLQTLQQQQDKENTRTPNITAKSTSSSRKPEEATQVAAKSDSDTELTEEQQRLLDRLAVGERAQVSAQEMKERTRRNYQKLPEVVERKRQEEILRRRKQRLAELREQEKVSDLRAVSLCWVCVWDY